MCFLMQASMILKRKADLMSQNNQKQSFLHGAAVLALATFIVKLIGFCYKIPLVRIIGNQGYTYFLTAYDIYSVMLTISTAGLPVAMSRLISQAQTLGSNAQIRRIYRASLYIFLTIGTIGALACCSLPSSWQSLWKLRMPGSVCWRWHRPSSSSA